MEEQTLIITRVESGENAGFFIKEEDAVKDEEEKQLELAVDVKEEQKDEEEVVVIEPTFPVYEICDDEKDPPEEMILPHATLVIVPERGDEYPEEEILPHAAMVIVPERADGYPEEFVDVEEHVSVTSTVEQQKLVPKIEDTVYRCSNCSLSYTSPEYLERHVRRACRYRPTPIKNGYPCCICGEGFNSYGSMSQHKRKEHEHTPLGRPPAHKSPFRQSFQCPNCPKIFNETGYLVRHQRRHIRCRTDRSCDLCGEDFQQKSRSAIEEHFAMSHPTKLVYRCNQCRRIYGQQQNYVAHLEAHGVFGCFVCYQQFSRQKELLDHICTHGNDLPLVFKCGVCCNSYLQQDQFYEHLLQEHGINVKPRAVPRELVVKELGHEVRQDANGNVQVVTVAD